MEIPELRAHLSGTNGKKQFTALQRVQLPEQREVTPLIVHLAVEGKDRRAFSLAKKRLRYVKKAAQEPLLQYLERKKGAPPVDPDHQARAIHLLGFIEADEAVPRLLEFGKTAPEPVLAQLLITLGTLGDPRAVPFIVSHLHDKDFKIQHPAIVALGNFPGDDTAKHLVPFLQDKSPKIQRVAITSLGRLGDPSVLEALDPVLHARSEKTRTKAQRLKEKCEEWIRDAPLIAARKEEEADILALVRDVEPLLRRLKDAPADQSPRLDVIPFDQYNQMLQRHLKQFHVEFERYFRDYGDPISSFDTELFFRYPVLYMGLTLRGPTDVESFGAVVPTLEQGVKRTSKHLDRHLNKKLQSLGTIVTAHGLNNVERQSLYRSGVQFVDTRQIVEKLRKTKFMNMKNLPTTGLARFEKAVHFKRHACDFWKHKISEEGLMAQMVHALREGLGEKNYRTCKIDGRPQDHFLYCLEDALSSLLIYVYVKNRFEVKTRGGRSRRHHRRGRGRGRSGKSRGRSQKSGRQSREKK